MDLLKEYEDVVQVKTDLSKQVFEGLVGDKIICEALRQIRDYSETTFRHSLNVYAISQIIGNLRWIIGDPLYDLGRAALLHDVGKIKIPKEILHKPGVLTRGEYEVMKKHVIIGGSLVKQWGLSNVVLQGVVQHHERIDGSGYPKGLRGDEISTVGRIIAVADIFEAITAKREYKCETSSLAALDKMHNIKNLDEVAFDYLSKYMICNNE